MLITYSELLNQLDTLKVSEITKTKIVQGIYLDKIFFEFSDILAWRKGDFNITDKQAIVLIKYEILSKLGDKFIIGSNFSVFMNKVLDLYAKTL